MLNLMLTEISVSCFLSDYNFMETSGIVTYYNLSNVRQLSRVILDISRLQGITLPYVYNECFFYCSSLRTLCVSFQYLTFVGFLS